MRGVIVDAVELVAGGNPPNAAELSEVFVAAWSNIVERDAATKRTAYPMET